MEPSKLYIIDENTLKHLLARDKELTYLECAGVDNWSCYGEGRDEFILRELTKINGCVSTQEVEEGLEFEDIAYSLLDNFTEYHEPSYEPPYKDDLK